MLEQLETIIQEYSRRNAARLSICYPSLGSTGFQERNQTNNFLAAAEKVIPDLFDWYEFQINGDKGADNHLDAIAIDFKAKEIWMIESKRIQSERKTREILNDKARMRELASNPKTIYSRFYDEPNIPFDEFKIYGVTLADVWNYQGQADARMKAYQEYLKLAQNPDEKRKCHICQIPIQRYPDWQYRLIVDVERLK